MFKRFLHRTSFFRPPIQFTAKEILEYSKIQYENAIDSEFFVNEDTPNLNIYSTMKNHNLNYIKVLDNSSENKMIGILNINHVRNRKLWYEYELEEYENIIEDLPKN